MDETNRSLPDELRNEVEQTKAQYLMSPTERRRKLIRWAIRQMLTAILYFAFWDAAPWVPKTLWFVIPLAILSLLSIVGYNWFLERKLRSAQAKIDTLEEKMKDLKED